MLGKALREQAAEDVRIEIVDGLGDLSTPSTGSPARTAASGPTPAPYAPRGPALEVDVVTARHAGPTDER